MPMLAAGEFASLKLRQNACLHNRRLPASRWPKDRQKALLSEALDDLFDQSSTSEVIPLILFLKRIEPEIRAKIVTQLRRLLWIKIFQCGIGRFKSGAMYPDFTLDGMIIGINRMFTLGSFLSSPTVVDGVLYVGSTDGNLYALK